MPGPPPDPHARRKNKRPDWLRLPSAGRSSDPPDFPLPRPSAAVRSLWAELWRSPQAVAWESLGWTRVVARYAKLLVAAEKAAASAALLSEVRQLEDRLGLTPMAMKRLQWEIASDLAGAKGEVESAGVANLDEYRARLG